MKKKLSITEYRSLAYTLRPIKPLGTCCSNVLLETIHEEPLESKPQDHRRKKTVLFSAQNAKRCMLANISH